MKTRGSTRAAADCVVGFRSDVPALADDMAKLLNDRDPDVRFRAARALWLRKRQGTEAAIQALIALAGSPDLPSDPGRFEVVTLIQKTGEMSQIRAISALIPLVDAKDPSVRREAVECLAAFGPQARVAVPSLQNVLQADDRVLRCLAALALSGIEGWDKDRVRATLGPLFDDLALPPQMRQAIDSMTESNLAHRLYPEHVQSLRKSLETCLRQAQKQANRLSHLVDQQIQFARADSGAGAVNVENLDLGRLLEELVEVCAPEAEAQGCRLELRSSGPVRVRGERALLNRAFENVLRNAIRRAPRRSARRGRGYERSSEKRATISIRDHGLDVGARSVCAEFFKPSLPRRQQERGSIRRRTRNRPRRAPRIAPSNCIKGR